MEMTQYKANQHGVILKFTRTVLLSSFCAMIMIFIASRWSGMESKSPGKDTHVPDPRKDTARIILMDSIKEHKSQAD